MADDSMNGSSSINRSWCNERKIAFQNILENVTSLEDEVHDNLETMKRTSEILKDVESLYSVHMPHPGEIFMDSKVLCATSLLAVRCSEAASGNMNKYDKHVLAQHIASTPDYWEFCLPLEAPPVPFLYGTFAPTPPELRPRPPRKRVERQKATAVKVPQNKERVDKTDSDMDMVAQVYTIVERSCREGPLSYFRAVLDPTSFTKTVENIYYLSFLVKDGRLEVSIDESTGLPYVMIRPRVESRNNNTFENQFIVSMDMKLYRALIKAFDIREPMMVIKKK